MLNTPPPSPLLAYPSPTGLPKDKWPRPEFGGSAENSPPGFWVAAARSGQIWSKGNKDLLLPHSLRSKLVAMPALREPRIRGHKERDRPFRTAESFIHYIGRVKTNIEAFFAQANGRLRAPTDACTNCINRHGPFCGCADVPGTMEECANCHFAGHKSRCSLLAPATPSIQHETQQGPHASLPSLPMGPPFPANWGPFSPQAEKSESDRTLFHRVMGMAMAEARSEGELDIFDACKVLVDELVFGVIRAGPGV